MNLKEKWKRFWTLNVHDHQGFTLVELIIVIAILAILSGVAVVGYSSYVEKANKQADLTLIAEIENILTLAGYDGTFADGGGCILLSANGVQNANEIEGTKLDEVLTAAYGENWANVLSLKYSKWGSNGLFDNLNPEFAYAVANSSYLTGLRADDLLKDVEIMTGMATNLVTVLGQNNGFTEDVTLSGMFTKDGVCAIDATAAKYGISKDPNETWEQWAAKSDENNTTYSNLLVMTAADESEKFMSGSLGTGEEYEMSGASTMILTFSSFYAYAAIEPEFSDIMDDYMAHLNGTGTVDGLAPVTDATTGAAWYNALLAAAGPGYEEYIQDSQAEYDQAAFLSIMSGIGNPSSEQANKISSDLSNANLFTDGVVNEMYNNYLDGVDALAGTYDPDADYADYKMDLGNGNVAILIVVKNGEVEIANSLSAN